MFYQYTLNGWPHTECFPNILNGWPHTECFSTHTKWMAPYRMFFHTKWMAPYMTIMDGPIQNVFHTCYMDGPIQNVLNGSNMGYQTY